MGGGQLVSLAQTTMRRFSKRNGPQDDEQSPSEDPADSSPARSYASSTSRGSRMGLSAWRGSGGSASGGGGGGSGGSWAGGEETPPRIPTSAAGTPPKPGTNKKMLKIGANVRFRGDVMECDTVILCGRLEVCYFIPDVLSGAWFCWGIRTQNRYIWGVMLTRAFHVIVHICCVSSKLFVVFRCNGISMLVLPKDCQICSTDRISFSKHSGSTCKFVCFLVNFLSLNFSHPLKGSGVMGVTLMLRCAMPETHDNPQSLQIVRFNMVFADNGIRGAPPM